MKSAISSLYTRITEAVSRRRFSLAFELLQTLAATVKLTWDDASAIERLKDNYLMMRRFAVSGAADPQREAFASGISADILRMADTAMRKSFIDNAPGLYYSTIRVEALQPDSSLDGLIEAYRKQYARMSMAQMGNNPADSVAKMRAELDALANRIFGIIWTMYPLSPSSAEALLAAFSSNSLPSALKEMMLSALMLGNIEFHDELRLTTLAMVYMTATGAVEMRALASLMIALWASRHRLHPASPIRNVLSTIAESKATWVDDLKSACLSLARTRDTQRVSSTLRDEIIPEMMKLRPDLMKGMDKSGADITSISLDDASEFNPEWEEIIEKSGLGAKLRAFSDLQAEGADVMMGTFANLKGFPFFKDPAAWFTPFEASHSAVTSALGTEMSSLASILENIPGICHGDKFSLILSLDRVPSESRRAMAEQLNMQDAQFEEMLSSELHPELLSRTRRLDGDIHDAYRFFNLYRRKGEFSNPFADSGITLAAVPALIDYVKVAGALEPMGEFYFRKGYYKEALPLFEMLAADVSEGTMPRSDLFQKIGYCYQSAGEYQKALDFYRKSEIIAPDSLWTIKRIAICSRKLGLNQQALEYYTKVAAVEPASVANSLSMGHCLLSLGRVKDAMASYYKAHYLSNSDDAKYIRPLAWCAFLEDDFVRAEELYRKLNAQATAADWLNSGHVAMARKEYGEAVERYRRASADADLTEMIDADREVLLSKGVDALMLDLIVDAALS